MCSPCRATNYLRMCVDIPACLSTQHVNHGHFCSTQHTIAYIGKIHKRGIWLSRELCAYISPMRVFLTTTSICMNACIMPAMWVALFLGRSVGGDWVYAHCMFTRSFGRSKGIAPHQIREMRAMHRTESAQSRPLMTWCSRPRIAHHIYDDLYRKVLLL